MIDSRIEMNDVVVFENVADQYVKGEDVHVDFTILNHSEIHPDEDRIGLIRVGASNAKDCLISTPITLNSTTAHHGRATFLSSSLNMSDDEFYQFSYLNHQDKILALSIPFQLNCSSDDIVLLTSTIGLTTINSRQNLIALADDDQDDLVVIHTKGMLLEEKLRQENRQLLEKNRRLEEEHEQIKLKFDLNDTKFNEYLTKTKSELQILAEKHKQTIDELNSRQRIEAKLRAEYETSVELCHQYQNESLRFAERCRDLEETHSHLKTELHRFRTQLSSSNQLVDEQTIQIVELEKSLIASNEALKISHQQQNHLEQQIRDLRLSTEKYQMNLQCKLEAFAKQASQHENQIHALETANNLLKNELKTVNDDKTFLLTMIEEDKLQAKQSQDEIQKLQMEKLEAQKQIENLRRELEENRALVQAVNEIQKRCVKHQKGEIDAKRKVEELTERLTIGGDEYKSLYRKYVSLQQSIGKNSKNLSKQNSTTTLSNETGLNEEALVSLLRNSYELQQQQQQVAAATTTTTVEPKPNEEETKQKKSNDDEEIRECPMCYWEFPNHLTLDRKKEHIDAHFD